MRSLSLFLIFICFSSVSLAELGPIKIRESKNYREIIVDGKSLLLNKKTFDVFLKKDTDIFKVLNTKYSKTAVFEKSDKGSSHLVYLQHKIGRKNQIGYYLRGQITQYKDEICDTKTLYQQKIKEIISPDLIAKIQALEVDNLFDKETCGKISPDQQSEFKTVLTDAVTYKTGQLQKCANSDSAQSIFLKDTALMQNALDVFGRYFSLIEGIQSSKLKLKCGLPKENKNKIASFSENPLEIALNIISDKFNLNISNIEEALNHELIHMGASQLKEKEGSRCLDEGFVQLFENVCKYIPKNDAKEPPSSSTVVESCLKGVEVKLEKLSSSTKNGNVDGTGGPGSAAGPLAMVSNAPLENREQNKATTEALISAANSTEKPAFQEIPNSVVQLAATAPVMTTSGKSLASYEGDGEFHAVVADSSFTSSVRQLGQSLAESMTNTNQLLTTALGNTAKVAAVAAVGSTAIAATQSSTGTKSGQYAPMTSSEIFANRYYPDSKDVQTAMNNPKLDSMTYDQKEAYYRSLGGKNSTQTTSVQLASDAGSGNKPTEAKEATAAKAGNLKTAKVADPAAQAVVAGTASRTVASLPVQAEGAPAASAEGEESSKKAQVENSGANRVTQPAPAPNSNIKLDNAILQRLTAFSKVNEPAYTRVTERFNDQTFRQQLDARKIRIVGENNKPLWASSVQPQRCFRDNKTTKVLEVVACK